MATDSSLDDVVMEEREERALMVSLQKALKITDQMKKVLGCNRKAKILEIERDDNVSYNGFTVLTDLLVDPEVDADPAVTILSNASLDQNCKAGDGTTSVVVLAGELLRGAKKLFDKNIHPDKIVKAYKDASECAHIALQKRATYLEIETDKFKEDLVNIAETSLSSTILSEHKKYFGKMVVDTLLKAKESLLNAHENEIYLDNIHFLTKRGGSLAESFLKDGIIIDNEIAADLPKRFENAKILFSDSLMETEKVKLYRARLYSLASANQIREQENERMRRDVEKIANHGIQCFIHNQPTHNFPQKLFADRGIIAIQTAWPAEHLLITVTGGELCTSFDNPESTKLGSCNCIEELTVGEDKLIHFSGFNMGQPCSIVMRGASDGEVEEASYAFRAVLLVLSKLLEDKKVLLGGGWPEMVMAKAVDKLAQDTSEDVEESQAIRAFAEALLSIPTNVASNAGIDGAEFVSKLRHLHMKEDSNARIDVITKSVAEKLEHGNFEAFIVKDLVLQSATGAVVEILELPYNHHRG